MKLLAALAAVAVTAVPIVHAPAPASAATSITVDTPNGDEFDSGEQVVVSGFNGSGTTETIVVECTRGWVYRTRDVPDGAFTVSVGSFTGPNSCRINDYYGDDLLARFSVAAPVTRVSQASVSATSFYPRVRDGYRDTVTFRWRQSHAVPATIQVLNSSGTVVRVAKVGSAGTNNAWRWDGRNRSGSPVNPGRFRIKVTANSNAVSAPVTVATGIVTRAFAIRREGNQASSMATRGDCFARRDSYYQVATLDCWGGRLARATYRIGLPRGAFDVRGTVDLMRTDLDYCCRGRITKGWSQPSRLVVSLWAKVTGWRATDVNFVRVNYKRRVRI